MSETKPAIIVGFVADLMFTSRIENAAKAAGFEMKWLGTQAELGEPGEQPVKEKPGEFLDGRDGQLFQQITAWQPALLLFDLTNEAIPWFDWLPVLKSSPATRRIPVLAFGPHLDVDLFESAKSRGADVVLARSRFFSDLPQLLQKYAKTPDFSALAATCAEPLSALAFEGIALFNQGQYYKCHDALEEAWNRDKSPGRDLYRGILQYGIALYQIERGNYRGAVKMLLRLRQWLDPLPAVCRGVQVARLRQNIQTVADAVQKLGAEQLAEFDFDLVQQIEVEG